MHELVLNGKHDLSLLGPVRATATDECTVTEDYTGWRALGKMDFLPYRDSEDTGSNII